MGLAPDGAPSCGEREISARRDVPARRARAALPSDWNPNASSAAYKAFEHVCRRDAKGADPISQRLAVRPAATSPKLAATSPKLSDNHCYLMPDCSSRSERVI